MIPFSFSPHNRTLSARGNTREELFINAAQGLMSVLVDPVSVECGGFRDRIHAEGRGLGPLLAAWLQQILFLYASQQEVFSHFEIRSLTNTSVEAEGEGELLDPGRHQVREKIKAVQAAGVTITPMPDGCLEAQVVIQL